jgi:hypothetical protein
VKVFTWLMMSIFVALVISWPLILLGASRETVGVLSLLIGAGVMLWPRRGAAPAVPSSKPE